MQLMCKVALVCTLFLFLLSCKETPVIEKTENFREKNPINNLKLNLTRGEVYLSGWANDFIEIQSTRQIRSNVAADLGFLRVDFSRDNHSLTITGDVPSRIEGEINFTIFVPYKLVSVNMSCLEGKIFINDYYGDLVARIDEGRFDGEFKGKLLRFDTDSAALALRVDSHFSCDLVINNRRGKSNIVISQVEEESFMDFKSEEGDLVLFIARDIPYSFISRNTNEASDYNLTIGNIRIVQNKYLYAPDEHSNSDLDIFVNNEKGIVVVNEKLQ